MADLMGAGLKHTVNQAQASARAQNSMDPVKLIASDGSEIILDRRAAMVSGTIKSMLSGPGESPPARSPRRPYRTHPRGPSARNLKCGGGPDRCFGGAG